MVEQDKAKHYFVYKGIVKLSSAKLLNYYTLHNVTLFFFGWGCKMRGKGLYSLLCGCAIPFGYGRREGK